MRTAAERLVWRGASCRSQTRPSVASRKYQDARWPVALVALLWCYCAASPVRAQNGDVDTQRFKPAATSGGFLQTEGSHVRYPVDPFSLGVWLSYSHNALIATDPNGDLSERIISTQLGLDVTGSYAFADWFELGLHAPLAYLDGDAGSEAALGDLRLVPKFRLLSDERSGIGLALIPELRAPTHTSRWYGGERFVGFAPRLALDHRLGYSGLRLGLELGFLLQKATRFREVRAGSEFQAGLGLGYRFAGGRSPVELMIDMRAAVGLAEADVEEVGLEGLLGLGIDLGPEWKLHVGGGLGLLEGFGVPTARALIGLRYEPSGNDPDHDGLRSPKHPERSGVEGAQPDDRARSTPEPEQVAQNLDAVDDQERARAIREGYDACPDLPEDYDGDEDEDGCPEGDRDEDGVLDYLDRCPDSPETINGFEDDDGCEDAGPAQIVIEEGRLAILETIRFEPGSARVSRDSYPILDQIVLTLRKYRRFDAIEIAGHTDSTGPHDLNMRLSRDRTRAVRSYLVSHGIKPERLRANGYGPDRPIADNGSEEGRAQNRRVEFLIHHQTPAH